MNHKYVIGIDFGTDSVRSVIVDTTDGAEIASSVFEYPRWKEGRFCDPAGNRFRQHPLDYIEGLEETVTKALAEVPAEVTNNVVAITADTTGSTPVAVNREGVPLALIKGFEKNPNAMFILWKDHTAIREAGEINILAHTWRGIDYTKYEGGIYSSEWFWAKILHVLRIDKKIRKEAFSWVEHCDWIPALLTGNTNPLTLKRSRCAAGHKAMWHESYNGLPSDEFLSRLDPLVGDLRNRLYRKTYTVDQKAGVLCPEWAGKLGLSRKVKVGVGAFDAHLGAVGGGVEPGYLSKVMGTSTCDMMVVPPDQSGKILVPGICGQVEGSITPGMIGLEAGQSAFGDVYAWYKNLLLWPLKQLLPENNKLDTAIMQKLLDTISDQILPVLSEQAAKIPLTDTDIIALDWLNGRRTPDANPNLKGAVTGLTLGSDAPRIFRALVEATAFGSRLITDRIQSEGVQIKGVIALGGVAKKSPFVMQTLADVLNKTIKVARSGQTVALGAAMAAAVVAAIYATLPEAQKAMESGFEAEYFPDPGRAGKYDLLYKKYRKLGYFIEKELT